MLPSCLPSAALSQLVHTLRSANAHHSRIASLHRSRLRLTHHAKRRANWIGLRVDTEQARNCPSTYVSHRPLPVIENVPEPVLPQPPFLVPSMGGQSTSANGFGLHLTNLTNYPEAPNASPPSNPSDHLELVTIRLSPLHLNYTYPGLMCNTPVPGAPLLKPKQLPEEDVDMVDMSLDQGLSSSGSSSFDLSTPDDVAYTELKIVIPVRSLKRKLQDVESEDSDIEASYPHRSKRMVKRRWPGSPKRGSMYARA